MSSDIRYRILFIVFSTLFSLNLTAKEPLPTLTLLDGTTIAVGIERNKPLYLKFWATWCGECQKQMPHLEKIQQKYANQLDVIAVNPGWSESLDEIKSYQEKKSLKVPIAYEINGALAERLGIKAVPYSVLFDKEGNIVHQAFGLKGLQQKLDELLEDN